MKKVFILIATTTFLFSCQASKEKARENFVENCKKSANSVPDITESQKVIFDKYCDCSADKVLAKYSVAEIVKMEKQGQDKFMEELMPVIQPCIDDMLNAMQQEAISE